MSVSSFKYPDRFKAKNATGETYEGTIIFKKENKTWISNPGGIALSLPPNSTSGAQEDYQTIDLYEYADGTRVCLDYVCYVTQYTTGETYHLSSWIYAVGPDGEITYPKTSFVGGTMNRDALSLGVPYENCYYMPGYVAYTQNNPTIEGEEATRVAFGAFYTNNINQLIQYPFSETSDNMTGYLNCWILTMWLPSDSDQIYEDRRDRIFPESSQQGDAPVGPGQEDPKPDPSRPGGGDRPGYGPDDGDPIDFPALPTTSALATGLISAYNPTNAQLNSLAGELWSNTFFDSISKILNDPFDAIIGLSMLPFDIPEGNDGVIKIGNYESEVTAKRVTAQYVAIDGGSFEVPQAWNNFLDFTVTKIALFLPFVGIVQVNTDDVMGKTIAVQYNIDILSGAGICCVKCGQSVLYTYPVNVAYNVPMTGSNKAALYTGLIQTGVTAIGGAVLTGGVAGAAIGAASGAISSMTSKQSDVQRSGGLTSNSGIMGDFDCYLIIHRPVQSIPQDFKAYKGYTSNISTKLSQARGYTEVMYINLAIPGATDQELEEIRGLLKDGVLI